MATPVRLREGLAVPGLRSSRFRVPEIRIKIVGGRAAALNGKEQEMATAVRMREGLSILWLGARGSRLRRFLGVLGLNVCTLGLWVYMNHIMN